MNKLPYGTLSKLTRRSKIDPTLISAYINLKKRPGRKRALVLENSCRELGFDIPAMVWLYGTREDIKGRFLAPKPSETPSGGEVSPSVPSPGPIQTPSSPTPSPALPAPAPAVAPLAPYNKVAAPPPQSGVSSPQGAASPGGEPAKVLPPQAPAAGSPLPPAPAPSHVPFPVKPGGLPGQVLHDGKWMWQEDLDDPEPTDMPPDGMQGEELDRWFDAAGVEYFAWQARQAARVEARKAAQAQAQPA